MEERWKEMNGRGREVKVMQTDLIMLRGVARAYHRLPSLCYVLSRGPCQTASHLVHIPVDSGFRFEYWRRRHPPQENYTRNQAK